MITDYINIASIQTYLPSYVMEEVDESTINKWALQGFRQNVTIPSWIYELRFCLLQLDNHVATLPTGLKKISVAQYSKNLPPSVINNTTDFIIPIINNERVFIAQAIVYQYFKPTSQTMRFVGQDSSLLTQDCVNIFCDCEIGFSIDRTLNTITTDMQDGYVILLYESEIQDEDGNFLIPNDEDLKQALSYYIEGMLQREFRGRHIQGASELMDDYLFKCNNKFQEFHSKNLLRYFDPDDYVFKSTVSLQVPQIATERSRLNYKKWRRLAL